MRRSRFSALILLSAAALLLLLLFSPSSRTVATTAVGSLPAFDNLHSQFTWHEPSHKPPEQQNSTSGDARWYSDWTWLNPFSSSVTLDEDRAVLPPLATRVPVYTYYEVDAEKNETIRETEKQLLLIWRRAWWAHGFKPVILTQAEARRNPLYNVLKQKGLSTSLDFETSRWLAWSYMGTGLLASWLCVPMADPEDQVLGRLRQGQFTKLVRFEGVGSGLFAGHKTQIDTALQETIRTFRMSAHIDHTDMTETFTQHHFQVEHGTAFANYDSRTLASKYAKIATLAKERVEDSNHELARLINAHLHNTWQNAHEDGVRVLKPLPAHTTKLIEPGQRLATLLAECPGSLVQASCPPNRPKCKPCVTHRMPVKIDESFRNKSSMFAIATIPHPLTRISLDVLKLNVNVSVIRRDTKRDPWITAATRGFLGDGRGGMSRLIGLKEVIAAENLHTRGLWFTVEQFPANFIAQPNKEKAPTNDPHPQQEALTPFPEHWLEHMDWHFGFSIPRTTVSHGETFSPVPGQGTEIKGIPADFVSSYDPPPPTYEQAQTEIQILESSRKTITSRKQSLRNLRAVAEAWHLADTEVWKFARAYQARSVLERRQWEEEESAFNYVFANKQP